MINTIPFEHGRELGANAAVTDDVVEEIDKGDGKTPAQESRQHSIASSSRTDHDTNDDESHEAQDVDTIQATTTNSEPWSVFTTPQKRFIVLMVALASFFSPLSANIYFPALNELATDFGVSESIMNLTLTSYEMIASSLCLLPPLN
jgi:Ca2+/Na+ antiporter